MNKTIPLLPLALGLTLGLSGCDTVSDAASGVGNGVSNVASALDPTNWFGGDDNATASDAPPDAGSQTAAPAADTDASTSPDLANLPSRPATSTPAQQQAAAQSLAQDGAQARYSADALRAGTEPSAPPPAAADASSARLAANDAPPTADAPPATDAPPTAGAPSAANAPPSAQASAVPPSATAAAEPPPSAQPAAPAAAPPPSALAQGTGAVSTGTAPAGAVSAGAAPPVQTAALAPSRPAGAGAMAAMPAPGSEPAVPAVPPNTPVRGAGRGMTNQVASDAALGFQPSTAPPLNSSISQWVSPPIVARYRQTASNAGIAPASQAAVPVKGGAAGLDTISTGPAGTASMNGGVPPTAVVYFPGDGTKLSAAGRKLINTAVAQYKASGGSGSIRVVGHSSSRTANMPVEKHLEVIFEKSQQRADAVAQELIHEGVPADRVLIEAVGDSQPVYFESMPQGEEGNRRAEIFLQG